MRNPHGHIASYGPDRIIERDTFTCVHCNSIVIVKPAAAVADCGGWCLQCSRPVCKHCAGKGCTPFEKQLEKMEQRDMLRRSMEP